LGLAHLEFGVREFRRELQQQLMLIIIWRLIHVSGCSKVGAIIYLPNFIGELRALRALVA
jgi:hypothetical protein